MDLPKQFKLFLEYHYSEKQVSQFIEQLKEKFSYIKFDGVYQINRSTRTFGFNVEDGKDKKAVKIRGDELDDGGFHLRIWERMRYMK